MPPDTDGDGRRNPDDPDEDNDGASDAEEAVAGTDPLNPDSILRFTGVQAGTGGNVMLGFDSVTGRVSTACTV